MNSLVVVKIRRDVVKGVFRFPSKYSETLAGAGEAFGALWKRRVLLTFFTLLFKIVRALKYVSLNPLRSLWDIRQQH